ncbi:ferredoxin family protein [Thermostilla marina]
MARVLMLISSDSRSLAAGKALDRIAQELGEIDGVDVSRIPSLYDLPDTHPLFAQLARETRPIGIVSHLAPRAIYWLLRARGIDARYYLGIDGIPLTNDRKRTRPEDAPEIRCITVPPEPRIERLTTAVRRWIGDLDAVGDDAVGAVEIERDEAVSERWYPVVDFERCTDCYECLNFCLFGVYDLDENSRIFVAMPDECRPGCPACSRVCPTGAILFPRHDDPAVSGRSVNDGDRRLDPSTAAEERAAALREQKPTDPEAESEEWITPLSDLERWVKEIDDFEG